MYEAYWELDRKPFEDLTDASFFFASDPHQGAALKLRYAVENKRGAALLTGAAGVGKSLLVSRLFGQLPDECMPRTHVVFPQLPAAQLISYLTAEICQSIPAGELQENVRELESFLIHNGSEGRHAVVAIDEAHLLNDPATLELLRLLLNFEYEGERCLSMLLIGQPQVLTYLNRCAGLDDRVAVKSLIRPLDAGETNNYIEHRLAAAGSQRSIFEEEAKSIIFQHSGGVPRRVNRLCDLALLIGFAEQQSTIGAEQIEAVAAEIIAVRPEAA